MAKPVRKRPGAVSPIVLVPEVEPVRTSPVGETPAQGERVTTVAPTVSEETPSTPNESSATEAEDNAGEKELSTEPPAPPAPSRPRAAKSARAEGRAAPKGARTEQEAPQVYIPPNAKEATNFQLNVILKLRAQTAVVRTQLLPGGYSSFASLLTAALEEKLERMEEEFGEEFEPNLTGRFRTGRPLGS